MEMRIVCSQQNGPHWTAVSTRQAQKSYCLKQAGWSVGSVR